MEGFNAGAFSDKELVRTRYPIFGLLASVWTFGERGKRRTWTGDSRIDQAWEGWHTHTRRQGGNGERGRLVSFEGPVRENERSASQSSTVCPSSLLVPSAKV